MGGGHWDESRYTTYARTVKNTTVDRATGKLVGDFSVQEMFKSKRLDPMLNIKHKVRECCDSEEHPTTIPVILGIDVTGSMGRAATEVAQSLNPIMTRIYKEIPHVQIMVIAIGDLSYDESPLQVSQFESDIRIAEQLDKVYFEGRGGGNHFESYSEAWFVGLRCCKLDCWKRGKKGLIITTGDEPMNPYLPASRLSDVTGIGLEADISTAPLYREASKKFDIHHIAIDDRSTSYSSYSDRINDTWGKLLGEALHVSTISNLENQIVSIIKDFVAQSAIIDSTPLGEVEDEEHSAGFATLSNGGISW